MVVNSDNSTPKTASGVNPFPALQALQRLAISESGFVFDPESGHHFSVNDTGKLLLRKLQQGSDFDVLLDDLTDEYDISRQDLERDILEFAALLRDFIGT